MNKRIIEGLDGMRGLVGQELGVSDWHEITQERINTFAEATGDFQWIHIDIPRATAESGYGGTVAHGFLTLSIVPLFKQETFEVTGISAIINYGLNKVRFPNAVLSGSKIRGRFHLAEMEDKGEGKALVHAVATVEIEGQERPACVAELMSLYIE